MKIRVLSLTQQGYLYFVIWFILNVLLTIISKVMLAKEGFPFPMLMTAVHMVFTYIGAELFTVLKISEREYVTRETLVPVVWFSLVFTINIWLSNASLALVSIDLHQIVRTTIPFFTMGISLLFFKQSYPLKILPSVVLVVVGVALAMWRDVEVNLIGLVALLGGCVFSSLKGILTQRTQAGKMGFSTLQLLRIVCPLAVMELVTLSILTGEARKVFVQGLAPSIITKLSFVGVCAFLVNFTSFRCAALLNPLTLNIAGNVKQVLTSVLGVLFAGGIFTIPLVSGITLSGVGAVWYTVERQRSSSSSSASKMECELSAQIPEENPEEVQVEKQLS